MNLSRNRYVAKVLQVIDLLTAEEESVDIWTHHLRFASGRKHTTDWVIKNAA